MKQVFLIAGPTASGKSALSLQLAKDINGIIINADSMQVYDGLRIVTACPSEDDEKRVPHRLYRFLDAQETCSAAFWAERAMAEIERAWAKGLTPIVVGGTGMYLKVLVNGIAHIPEIDETVRELVRHECTEKGSEYMHQLLAEHDPVTAERLFPGDSQRICRALEVFRSTGKSLSEWHKNNVPGLLSAANEAGHVAKVVLSPDRKTLYENCDKRFDIMLRAGALDEVRELMQRNLPKSLPAMRALGVPQLMDYLNGINSLDVVTEEAKMQTRRFAKRQLTWFRNQFFDWFCIDAQFSERNLSDIVIKIHKKLLTE
ncbi:tRNA (adenosine(37)-N6)-dimethylallyltransferase MiaA [Kordiimonas pumila]|uniref:tRNA dimethylallyltransferase n=1 Tax=Kordiimonas pumila TaxID=2161677 RepID=A0ABV7D8Z9_9PROT|nr:tRNA (adenosine(37)-N6)-dimethylallyltransferase MiaA [Kordiimonas pumila]